MTYRSLMAPESTARLPGFGGVGPNAVMAVVLALLLCAVRALEHAGSSWGGVAGYVLTAAAALALAYRLRWPRGVFAVTLVLVLCTLAFARPSGAASVAVVIAIYTLAFTEGRRRALALTIAAGAALALTRGLLQYRGWSDARTALEPALAMAALFLGWAISSRRAYVSAVEARALQAERTREEEARTRVDAERLRIARELHDVLAHTIATISVQAGAASHVLEQHPEQAQQALGTIKETSKEALRELRGMLGLLRQVDDADGRDPAPGLGQLDALVSSTVEAGLPTRIIVSGARRPLPSSIDLAAYRIVQESLTNVLRHAGGTRAVVEIRYDDAHLTITVEDDGAGGGAGAALDSSPRAGHGILGMRERAQTLGGEVQAGPRATGGFEVRARLPTAGASS